MKIKTFIEKAIEGGWNPPIRTNLFKESRIETTLEQMVLDPSFWQAVGKVEGWATCEYCYKTGKVHGNRKHCSVGHQEIWKVKMHAMIDACIEGKTLQEYIATL